MAAYRLMIVDDSNIIRNKIERDTTSMNQDFEVVAVASNGNDALRLFEEHRPDVVTMDLTMPSMDGLSCIQKLMAIDPNVNILVVSALADEYVGLQAMSYGARGFVVKPFKTEELMEGLYAMFEE